MKLFRAHRNDALLASTDDASVRVVRDASANLLRIVATAAIMLASTAVILRSLSKAEYSSWALVLGMAGYVAIAEVGLQGASVKTIASLIGRQKDPSQAVRVGFWGVAYASIVACLLVIGVAIFFRQVFSPVPQDLRNSAILAFVIMGCLSAISLPGNIIGSLFHAQHRAIVPALAGTVARGVAGAAVIVAAMSGSGIATLALITAGGTVSNAVLLISLGIRDIGSSFLRPLWPSQCRYQDLNSEALTMMEWSVATIAISGLDIVLVSQFDFASAGAYAVAVQVNSLVLVVFGAMMTPLLPAVARTAHLHTLKDRAAYLGQASRISVALLAAGCLTLFVWAPDLMRLYTGATYAHDASTILRILLLGTLIRQIPAALALLLVSSGAHKSVRVPPVLEALANLFASLLLGWALGAIGIAIGTVGGAIAAIACFRFWTVPRTDLGGDGAKQWLNSSLKPLMIAALVVAGSLLTTQATFGLRLMINAAMFVGIFPLLWRVGLDDQDRRLLRSTRERWLTASRRR